MIPFSPASGPTSERINPPMITGIATTTPAIGPATPTSRRILLSMMGDFILMKAPNVPMKEGAGMSREA